MPVLQTDGRSVRWCTVTWLPNFLGWINFLSYGASLVRAKRTHRAPLSLLKLPYLQQVQNSHHKIIFPIPSPAATHASEGWNDAHENRANLYVKLESETIANILTCKLHATSVNDYHGMQETFKTESIRKLSNINFQCTKALYQNNIKHNLLHCFLQFSRAVELIGFYCNNKN